MEDIRDGQSGIIEALTMEEQLQILIERYPKLAVCREDIKKAYELLETAYQNGKKLLVCGNGGSASDSEHIVGELMKEFKLKRKVYGKQAAALKEIDPELGQVLADNLQGALPAISLTGHSSLQTAFMNDVVPELVLPSRSTATEMRGMFSLESPPRATAKMCFMQPSTPRRRG